MPLPETLPTVAELLASHGNDAKVAEPEVARSPAHADAPDATAWLPLPELHALPTIDALLTPDPSVEAHAPRDVPVGVPSPARAEPHDATTWLPLPDTDALPDVGAGGNGKGRARRGRLRRLANRVPVRTLLVTATVLGVLGGLYWGTSRLLDPGADVDIVVDGQFISVETGVSSVSSLLEEQRIPLGEHDQVEPNGDAPIENNMTVRVMRAFPVDVDINGDTKTVYSAFHEPRRFLKDLDLGPNLAIRNAPKRITEATPIQIRTRKTGTLFLDGTAVQYESPSHSVRELLDGYIASGSLILGPLDVITPPIDEVLPDTASVTIIRVATDTQQVDEPYDLPDERHPDPNLEVGQTRVQQRKTGVWRVTYQIINHDGQENERIAISRVPIDPAQPRIEFHGTHYNPLWDKMAECETGGNWAAGGQTYQGGLGIFWKNWNYYGGRDFAPTGGQATKLEQIIVAERIRKAHGWHAWGCADDIGL